ncbi:MAG: serpin family protein, partial [Gemmatimonadaceae bacterium]
MKNSVTVLRVSQAVRLVGFVSLIAGATACSSSTEPKDGATPPTELTALPRALTATEEKVRNASNEFSFALMGTVTDAQKTSNTFLSPLSASFALGMVMNGANGNTYDEMVRALQMRGLSLSEINGGYKSLMQLLL